MSSDVHDKPRREDDVLHVYDDIEECDHSLPRWWLITLFGSMAFASVYWMQMEVFKTTDTPLVAYEKAAEAAASAEVERLKNMGPANDETLLALSQNEGVKAEGKGVFQANCGGCHLPTGGGSVGPNLTDNVWLHGGKPANIYKTVRDGIDGKGMAPWLAQLGEAKVRAVTAYVVSIKNTNVAGGKAPEGVKEP